MGELLAGVTAMPNKVVLAGRYKEIKIKDGVIKLQIEAPLNEHVHLLERLSLEADTDVRLGIEFQQQELDL